MKVDDLCAALATSEDALLVSKNATIDYTVLYFIAEMRSHLSDEGDEQMYKLFTAGYCYYFAVMLKAAFDRGHICVAAPFGHIVWVDENDIAYDYNGVNVRYECLIPVEALGNGLEDFLHVKGKTHTNTQEEIQALMDKYREV